MQLLDPRAALLANFEVLALLRALAADHVARTKHAPPADPAPHPDSLRTVQLEAIHYLAADFQPTARQSAPAIAALVRALAPFALTAAEKLQVINLAPTEPVELYVIVEEFEDRLGDSMDDILATVARSLSATAPAPAPALPATVAPAQTYASWEHDAEDAEFVDLGEGIGVEGDLDMEDDD